MVTTTDAEGRSNCWEWDVDPFTREPKIPKGDLYEIAKHVKGKRLIFHHGKFDIKALSTIGLYLHFPENEWNLNCHPWFLSKKLEEGKVVRAICDGWEDTLPASHIASSKGTHKLKELALVYFGYPETDEEELLAEVKRLTLKAKKLKWNLARRQAGKETQPEYEADYWLPKALNPDSTLCREYGTKDTERTMLLWLKVFLPMMEENPVLYRCYQREKKLIPVIYAMEHDGISMSRNSYKKYSTKLISESIPKRKKAENIAKKILGRDYFNINSPLQMKELLYTKKGFNFEVPKYTKTQQPSTDADSLDRLINQVPEGSEAYAFLDSVTESRLLSTGASTLSRYGHIKLPHPTDRSKYSLYFTTNPNGTDTTRSSCNGGQNISKKKESPLRNVFSPPEGKVWIPIDYQQLQLRIFAFRSGDKKLIKAFREGKDYHQLTGEAMFLKKELDELERRKAKAVNFGIIFGAKLNRVNSLAGRSDAYDNLTDTFPSIPKFINSRIKQVRETGGVTTAFGYPLDVSRRTPYAGANYDIQGTEGDIVKNAMVLLVELGLIDYIDYRLVLLVHDELIIEAPENYNKARVAKIMGVMEHAGTMLGMETPVDASIVETNWGHKKKLKDLKPIYPDAKKCKEIIYGVSA